jgi:hypothetical protein
VFNYSRDSVAEDSWHGFRAAAPRTFADDRLWLGPSSQLIVIEYLQAENRLLKRAHWQALSFQLLRLSTSWRRAPRLELQEKAQ